MRLERLTQYPEWQELVDTLAERRARQAEGLAARAMTPGGISNEEMLKVSHFWAGVDAVLETPGHIQKRLENAVRKAKSAQPDRGDE